MAAWGARCVESVGVSHNDRQGSCVAAAWRLHEASVRASLSMLPLLMGPCHTLTDRVSHLLHVNTMPMSDLTLQACRHTQEVGSASWQC